MDDYIARLALVRELAERWLAPRRKKDRRASLGLVLSIVRACGGDDPEVLARAEGQYLIEELLRRGRREDGARVTKEDLRAVGALSGGDEDESGNAG